MKHSITQFWYILEQLVPVDLQRKLNDAEKYALFNSKTKDEELPWLNRVVLKEKLELSVSGDENPMKKNYKIYLGVFPSDLLTEYIMSSKTVLSSYFEEMTSNPSFNSCFISFSIDPEGLLVEDSLSVSAMPWGIKKVCEKFAGAGELSLDGWMGEYNLHVKRLKDLFNIYASDCTPVGVEKLLILFDKLCCSKSQWFPKKEEFLHLGYYCIPKYYDKAARQEDDEDKGDILNSFLVKDLELVSGQLRQGNSNTALEQYLSSDENGFNSAEDVEFLREHLSPRYCPRGRWPSDPSYSLSLQQQCAVNLALDLFKDSEKGGIFSVNGPPGTGKTTLLKDLVAELIVRRAKVMASYDRPESAFVPKRSNERAWRLSSRLVGWEMVLASSNNGAVENVTAELPAMTAIASKYREDVGYFKKTANNSKNLKGSSQKQTEESWGLIAAVLGNKGNCSEFTKWFWYKGEDRLPPVLNETSSSDLESWKKAVDDFNRCSGLLEKLISERQKFAELVNTEIEIKSEYEVASSELKQEKLGLEEAKTESTSAEQKLSSARQELSDLENRLRKLESEKPCFLRRLFKTPVYKRYLKTLAQVREDLKACQEREATRREIYEQAQAEKLQKQQSISSLIEKIQQIQDRLDLVQAELEAIRQKGFVLADARWWGRPRDRVQLTAPWIDEKLNEARTQLFIAALKVHEQFIINSSKQIRANLSLWINSIKGNDQGLSNKDILYIWQTFFLVVPLVSTTFASVGRLFKKLGKDAIGWLLIDEAGQATPQAGVGALYRSRRVVVVGDPLQIKPVFALNPALVQGLRQAFNLDEHWCPDKASVQTLADRVTPYGTILKRKSGDPIRIGCPLWVHRRCIEPMVGIANEIAYDNKMVAATRPPENKTFPLGDSGWFDVKGSCSGKHWVPAQGEMLLQLLKEIVEANQALPDLFIITPFRLVAEKATELLRENQKNWASSFKVSEKWLKKSVGTVHTFQGKEAEVVIFVLGGDKNSRGALDWAAAEPNLLNVALTRAKYRFYAIGDKELWENLPYFSTACQYLDLKSTEL